MAPFYPRFLAVLITPLLPWLHWLAAGGRFDWLVAVSVIVAIHLFSAVIDQIVGDARHHELSTHENEPTHWANRAIPLLCVPAWFGALGFAAWQGQFLSGVDWIMTGIAIGVVGGITAINVAHELIHRATRFEREAGGVLLASVGYGAFRIEHVLGHHLNVATPLDTATALRGENVYRFFGKSFLGTLTNAWRIEKNRLVKRKLQVFSVHNRYLQGCVISMAIALVIAGLFGLQGVAMMALVSFVAIFELEVINYLEHYGLQRQKLANGRYEPFGPQHAWNANTAVMNSFLINLQRHADHHLHAGKDYMHLSSIQGSPQLPAGYAVMFLMAFIPSLWRKVMHPRLDALVSSQ
jgi:alkane 1-monooxygenase